MDEIHVSVWASIIAAVVAMFWFFGRSPNDQKWHESVRRVEKWIGWSVLAAICILILGGAVYIVVHWIF